MGRWEKLFQKLTPEAKAVLENVDTAEKALALPAVEREKYLNALDEAFGPKEKRAADMGFGPDTWYHGTKKNINEFDLSKAGQASASVNEPAVFLSSSPKIASDYSVFNSDIFDPKQVADSIGSNVMPVRVKGSTITNDINEYSPGKVRSALRKAGDENVHFKNMSDTLLDDAEDIGASTLGVKNPANIRSVNAAFDPRFKNSKKILAGAAGAGILGAATLGGDQAEAAPLNRARQLAEEYAALKKLAPIIHEAPNAKVNVDRAKRIAEAYEALKHDPTNPQVKAAYDKLIQETVDQFQLLKDSGLNIEKMSPGMKNPYKDSKAMISDVKDNNHLWYFPTEEGFGSGGINSDHPLFSPVKVGNETMPANDAFRVVHDYFGHAKEGSGFGAKGEENAWREHMKMFSPEAQKALTTETRGQNSWVNYGPHGEANRLNPANTIYADQKAGLLPDWASSIFPDWMNNGGTGTKALAAGAIGATAAGMPEYTYASPFNAKTIGDTGQAIGEAFDTYDKAVIQPLVKPWLDPLKEEIKSNINNITDLVTPPVQNKEKVVNNLTSDVSDIANFGLDMAADPMNIPFGSVKAPIGVAAGILGPKKAAQILENATKIAALEGKTVGQVVSEMILGKMPWKADMASAKNLEQHRLMMRDVLGQAFNDSYGIASDSNIEKAANTLLERAAPGFPRDKVLITNPDSNIIVRPDSKTITTLLDAGKGSKALGSLATGQYTGDILGLTARMERLPPDSQTVHQLSGLLGHEVEHGQDAAKYGVAKHVLEKPFNSSVLSVPQGTLDQRLDRASQFHHIDSPEQTIEKTLLDRLIAGEPLFPDLQQPVKRFTSDEAEIERLNKLIQQDPSLKDKLLQGMQVYDQQQAKPRFTKIRKGIK